MLSASREKMNALPLHAFGFVYICMVLGTCISNCWCCQQAKVPHETDAEKINQMSTQVKPKQGWRNTGFALKVECNLCPGGMVWWNDVADKWLCYMKLCWGDEEMKKLGWGEPDFYWNPFLFASPSLDISLSCNPASLAFLNLNILTAPKVTWNET